MLTIPSWQPVSQGCFPFQLQRFVMGNWCWFLSSVSEEQLQPSWNLSPLPTKQIIWLGVWLVFCFLLRTPSLDSGISWVDFICKPCESKVLLVQVPIYLCLTRESGNFSGTSSVTVVSTFGLRSISGNPSLRYTGSVLKTLYHYRTCPFSPLL